MFFSKRVRSFNIINFTRFNFWPGQCVITVYSTMDGSYVNDRWRKTKTCPTQTIPNVSETNWNSLLIRLVSLDFAGKSKIFAKNERDSSVRTDTRPPNWLEHSTPLSHVPSLAYLLRSPRYHISEYPITSSAFCSHDITDLCVQTQKLILCFLNWFSSAHCCV